MPFARTTRSARPDPGQLAGVIEIEQESDGRWIAEVTALPGTLAYGASQAEARSRAVALALHVIADRLDHGEAVPAAVRTLLSAA